MCGQVWSRCGHSVKMLEHKISVNILLRILFYKSEFDDGMKESFSSSIQFHLFF